MASVSTLFLAATCCVYLCLAHGEESFETRSVEFPPKTQEEKDLVGTIKWVFVLLCVFRMTPNRRAPQ